MHRNKNHKRQKTDLQRQIQMAKTKKKKGKTVQMKQSSAPQAFKTEKSSDSDIPSQASISQNPEIPQKADSLPSHLSIMAPAIVACESAIRRRVIGDLPAGYFRFHRAAYPPRNFIELTVDDYQFIQAEKQRHRYYEFYLLSPDRLLSTYIWLSKLPCKEYSLEVLKESLGKRLVDANQELTYAIFELLRQQQPERFDSFVTMLSKRWLFRANAGYIFRQNQLTKLTSAIQPYSVKNYWTEASNSKSTLQLRRQLYKVTSETTKLFDEYSQMRKAYESRKGQMINFMLSFLRNLGLISLEVPFEPILKVQSQVTLFDLDKKFRTLVHDLQKWKKVNENETGTSTNPCRPARVLKNSVERSGSAAKIDKF